MRTIVKRGSTEIKTVSDLSTFVDAEDNCVLGKSSIHLLLCCFILLVKTVISHDTGIAMNET